MILRSLPGRLVTEVHRRRHRAQYEMQARLHEVARAGAETVTREQHAQIARLLAHAAAAVPFYRARLGAAGYAPGAPFDAESFERIPPLTKADIREAGAALTCAVPGVRTYSNTSGGSTGEPVRLVQDDRYLDETRGATRYFYNLMGVEHWHPSTVLWGSERDILEGTIGLRAKVVNRLLNRQFLNAFRMTPTDMRRYVEAINRHRPVYVLAYVQSAFELARFIEENGLRVHSPRGVMTSAGTLCDGMRGVIEQAFGCPVFNRYGSREVGDVAGECEAHDGLHVAALTHYVEVVDPRGRALAPGETGEVLITQLSNYSMPLIRFRIGDMAALAGRPCRCGRSLPILARVVGRTVDVFVTPDGSLVDGEYFTHLFYYRRYLERFQVVQEDRSTIDVFLVLRGDHGRNEWLNESRSVTQQIQAVMGPTVRVQYHVVDDIPPSPSGKFRFTISKLRH